MGTLTWATDPWVTPTTLASVTTATIAATLSPWPTWPADTAGGAIAAKVSVVAGQRYWLQLNCPAPTTGAQGCAVGARFHTEEAPYPLTLTARKLSGRIKGSTSCAAITAHYYYLHFTLLGVELLTLPLILLTTHSTRCVAITDRDACCAALDNNDNPCVPAVVRFSAVVGTPVCLDAATAASQDHRSQIAACPLRADALGAARPRVTLDNQVACSSLTDRHACCGAIDGGTAAFRAGYACMPAATLFQNGNRCETT